MSIAVRTTPVPTAPVRPCTVPFEFVRSAAATAERRGADPALWLDGLGAGGLPGRGDRGGVPAEQATHLLRRMLRITGDEWFGLTAHPVRPGTTKLICLALLGAADLHGVLLRLEEFSPVVPGLPRVLVEPVGDRVAVRLDRAGTPDPEHFLTHLGLAAVQRLLSWLVGGLPLVEVALPHPAPPRPEIIDDVFGAPVRFDRPFAALVLDRGALTLPVVRDEADLAAWLRDLPAVLLGLRKDAVSLPEQVRRILRDGPAGHWPGPAEVAARLSMSPQNLRRRLREDGLSLTGIKVDLMRDTATTSLLRGGESVAQLSARLGFSEPSAFHRAFRRWTGVSPGAYRAVLRAHEASGTSSRPAPATRSD